MVVVPGVGGGGNEELLFTGLTISEREGKTFLQMEKLVVAQQFACT